MKYGSILCKIFYCIFVSLCYVTQYNYEIARCDENIEIKTFSEMEPRSSPIDIDIFKLEDKKFLDKTSCYNQVLTCYTKSFGDQNGRSTNVHETVHGINNALSNSRKEHRAFYAGFCRAIWIKEPKIKMKDIIEHIPDILKEYRYKLYFVTQIKYWEEVGLYPVDEWSAYISGGECAVDDYHKLGTAEKADNVSGALEFSIYCTALAKTVKIKDKDYWDSYPQFKNSIKFFLVRAEKVFYEGKDIFPSNKQDHLLHNLQKHRDAEPIRDFLLEEFNGVFIK